jgi:solute carrier family 25 carnitine/acylcarnitine transporter 20/29
MKALQFDTIKLRMQCSPPTVYKGPLDCLVQTVRHEVSYGFRTNLFNMETSDCDFNSDVDAQGPLAVYKGVTPQMLGFALSDSALMGSLHNYRLLLARRRGTDEGDVAILNHLEHAVRFWSYRQCSLQ